MKAQLQKADIIVFDLDDTLCPESDFVKSGFRAVAAFLIDREVTTVDLSGCMWARFCSGERGTIFNCALKDAGVAANEGLVQELVSIYRSHIPQVALYPDARYALEHLRGRKKLGLLSDGYLQSQKNKLSVLGIKDYFDVVLFTDELGKECWKPNTEGFKRIMHYCGSAAERCVYIGDNPAKDFYGARRLGWFTVQVRRPDGIYEAGEPVQGDYAPDAVIETLYPVADAMNESI